MDNQSNVKEKQGNVSGSFISLRNTPCVLSLDINVGWNQGKNKGFLFLTAIEHSHPCASVCLSIQNPSPSFPGAAVAGAVEVLHTGVCFGGVCHQYPGPGAPHQGEQELAQEANSH